MPGKYREVFTAEPGEQQDPGRIFYTVTAADIGRITIRTTAGPVHLSDWFGRIQACDVGKRLYRMPADGGIEGQPVTWIWQAENDRQRDERVLADRKQALHGELTAIRETTQAGAPQGGRRAHEGC